MTLHTFSDWLDEDCYRCETCGMNLLGDYGTCEGYTAYNMARNAELRAKAGL